MNIPGKTHPYTHAHSHNASLGSIYFFFPNASNAKTPTILFETAAVPVCGGTPYTDKLCSNGIVCDSFQTVSAGIARCIEWHLLLGQYYALGNSMAIVFLWMTLGIIAMNFLDMPSWSCLCNSRTQISLWTSARRQNFQVCEVWHVVRENGRGRLWKVALAVIWTNDSRLISEWGVFFFPITSA